MADVQSQIKHRLSGISGRTWLIIGGVFTLAIVLSVLAVTLLLTQGLVGGYVTLDAASPSIVHPDGLVVSLAEGTTTLKVLVSTVPREAFLSDQAGKSWVTAREALSGHLVPLSPIYTVQARGVGQVVAEMAIPNGAEPLALLDLYSWDEEVGQWVFIPSSQDISRDVIVFRPQALPINVIAAHAEPHLPTVGVIVSPDGPDLGPNYGLAMPEGAAINADGQLIGTPVAATGSLVLPIVKNREGGFIAYSDPGQQDVVINWLMPLAAAYNGLVLDFAGGLGYADFVAALAEPIHAHGKQLDIIMRGDPAQSGYDIAALAQHADRIWIAPSDNPMDYMPDGMVRDVLGTTVGMADRRKVGLLVSGLNVDLVGNNATPISTEQAMDLFGSVEPLGDGFDLAAPLAPGGILPLRLSGPIEAMNFAETLGVNYLTYHDAAGQLHHVYFSSAQSLRYKLSWARFYGLGSVAVYGLAHPDAPENLADGISAFLNDQPISNPPELAIVWRVQSASGASLSEDRGNLLLIQYLWQIVAEPGQYVISAAISGQSGESQRGQFVVEVAEQVDQPTPTSTPSPTPLPWPTTDPNATPVPTAAPEATDIPPTGPIAPGMFELGGQTHSLDHPNEMHHAGMKWVKFQHKWGEGDDPAGAVGGRIQKAHSQGFKVLLSIPGPAYPTSISYDAYINFLAGVAALGPDAIEVWNEMNFAFEWPVGEINGANYVTKMLAPAYQAIKAVNSNVMVISGAPTPTGYFGGCAPDGCDDWLYIQQMRDAGAVSYLDCVGIHYNEGIIPPSQTSGDPRSEHYTRYFFGMLNLYYGTFGVPVCFTELGYLTPEGYGPLPGPYSWAQNTTVTQQAAWLAEAAVLSSQSGKVRMMMIFNVDIFDYGSDPQGGYAIIRPGGGCPACQALHDVQP